MRARPGGGRGDDGVHEDALLLQPLGHLEREIVGPTTIGMTGVMESPLSNPRARSPSA